jgi:hypothetical protein
MEESNFRERLLRIVMTRIVTCGIARTADGALFQTNGAALLHVAQLLQATTQQEVVLSH